MSFLIANLAQAEEPPPGLDPARAAYRCGEYETALRLYREILSASGPPPADQVLAFTDLLIDLGRHDEAIRTCEQALEKQPGEAAVRIRHGEVLARVGRLKDSEAVFRSALETSPASLLARLGLSRVLRETGRVPEANALLGELVERYDADRPTDPERQLHYGYVFQEADRPHQALDLFDRAAKGLADPTDARLATGFLFLSKGQVNDAAKEFRPILKENPAHPGAHVGMAGCYFHDGDFPRVSEECQAAVAANPACIEALEMLAALCIQEEDISAAESHLQRALAVNPTHLSVRTRLACCHYLTSNTAAYEKECEAIFAIHPQYAEFYRSIGEAAERLRRPDTARTFYEEAYRMAPQSWHVLESLGFFYCREGREKEAYEILDRSFKLNAFNRRVYNLLNTLDYMDDFLTEESEHFILKVHRKKDACLAGYGLEYLHAAKEAFCRQYEFPISEKILVELFPRHDYFAARVHGLPGIGLNGVCFGKVIVADSPGIRPGALNWRDVLVHEFSHVVTLHATDYRIPRWLTEGLAVYDEGVPMSFEQDQILVTAWKRGEILPLARLNRGFTQPKSQFEILLAYIEARLAVEHLVTEYGFRRILELLKAIRQGDEFEAAVQKSLGVSFSQLSDAVYAFFSFTAEQLPILPRYGPGDLTRLENSAREHADQGAAHAEFALALLQCQRADAARTAAEKALQVEPDLALAHIILGEAALQKNDLEAAKASFARAAELEPRRIGPPFRLAAIAKAQDRARDGIEMLRKVIERYDRLPQAYELLAELAEAAEQTQTRLDALEGMIRFPETLGKATESLLKVYAAVDRPSDVERVALNLFKTNPYVVEAHDALARSYESCTKLEAAAREYLVCIQLKPTDLDYHLRLAKVLLANDQKEEARRVLTEAQKVDRSRKDVKDLLQSIPESRGFPNPAP